MTDATTNADIRLAVEKFFRFAIYVGSGVLAKYGIDSGQFTLLGVDAAVAIGTLLWGFLRARQLRDTVPPTPQADDLDDGTTPQAGRTLALVLVVGVASALLAGCATPQKRAYTLRVSYNAALREATALNKAGVIRDDSYVVGVRIALAARPLLDELDRAVAKGEGVDAEAAWTAASNVVSRLLEWLATTRAKH